MLYEGDVIRFKIELPEDADMTAYSNHENMNVYAIRVKDNFKIKCRYCTEVDGTILRVAVGNYVTKALGVGSFKVVINHALIEDGSEIMVVHDYIERGKLRFRDLPQITDHSDLITNPAKTVFNTYSLSLLEHTYNVFTESPDLSEITQFPELYTTILRPKGVYPTTTSGFASIPSFYEQRKLKEFQNGNKWRLSFFYCTNSSKVTVSVNDINNHGFFSTVSINNTYGEWKRYIVEFSATINNEDEETLQIKFGINDNNVNNYLIVRSVTFHQVPETTDNQQYCDYVDANIENGYSLMSDCHYLDDIYAPNCYKFWLNPLLEKDVRYGRLEKAVSVLDYDTLMSDQQMLVYYNSEKLLYIILHDS